MAYDPDSGYVEVLGGRIGGTAISPLAAGRGVLGAYYWTGTGLVRRALLSAPNARYGHALAYDGDHARLTMFGGRLDEYSASKELWEFTLLPQSP